MQTLLRIYTNKLKRLRKQCTVPLARSCTVICLKNILNEISVYLIKRFHKIITALLMYLVKQLNFVKIHQPTGLHLLKDSLKPIADLKDHFIDYFSIFLSNKGGDVSCVSVTVITLII